MDNRYDKFTSLIMNINRSIQKIKNVEMEDLGLKGKQVQCLFHLFNVKDGLTSTQLCSYCAEDKGAVSRTVKELVELGYVYVDEQSDKKYRNPIKLTKKGEEIGRIVVEKIGGFVNVASAGLADKTREELYSALTLISNNLQKICEELENSNG